MECLEDAKKRGVRRRTYADLTNRRIGRSVKSVPVQGFLSFGELDSEATATLFAVGYTRDDLGRITERTETVLGVTRTDTYTYDLAGRLTGVTRGGLPGRARRGPRGSGAGRRGPRERLNRGSDLDLRHGLLRYCIEYRIDECPFA